MLLQLFLQTAQRLSSVTDLILFLRAHLCKGSVSVIKYRIIAESAVPDEFITDFPLAGFLDF